MSPVSIPQYIGRPKVQIDTQIVNFELIRHRVDEKLTFSFHFFDRTHDAFNLGGVDESWLISFLDVIKEWSTYKWSELCKNRTYDPHDYKSRSPTQQRPKYDFPFENPEQYEFFQIRLSQSSGRVHGFLVGNVYYFVWLDPHHNMYESTGYEADKRYSGPATAWDKLSEEKKYWEDRSKSIEELCGECEKFKKIQ
jgi:hypothetical protein